MDRIREWMERNPEEGKELRRQQQVLCVLPRDPSARQRGADRRPGHFADAGPLDRGRSQAAHLRHAVLHLGLSADRGPEARHLVPPADDRAGHRRRDRRPGARRSLFRRRRRGRQRRRPAAPRRPLRHAGAEGARTRRATTRFRCPGGGRPSKSWRPDEKIAAKEEAGQTGSQAGAQADGKQGASDQASPRSPATRPAKTAAKTAEQPAEENRRPTRSPPRSASSAAKSDAKSNAKRAQSSPRARHDPPA